MPREKDFGPGDLGPPWTVLKLLRWTTQFFEDQDVTDTPRLDADLLLGHVLEVDRIQLYTYTDQTVDEADRARFRELVKRRAAGEPVAYLIGHRSFWQMELACDPRALIPRPDTEVLVEVALEYIPEDASSTIADIGTGTGAVALALARERPQARLVATDISPDALALAGENARRHELADRISFVEGDLLDAVPDDVRPLDAVVCNPPYVAEEDPDVEVAVRDHEPDQALLAGPEGLDVIERLVPQAFDALSPGGWLFFEIGHRQAEPARRLLEAAGFESIAIRTDYGDRDRVALGQR